MKTLLLCTTIATAAFAGDWQTLNINDPVLRMQAFSVKVPAGWAVSGAMIADSHCGGSSSSPAFRAASQDGMTGMYVEPPMKWTWSSVNMPTEKDCMPWRQISAKQILAYTISVLGVGYVQDLDSPGRAQAEAQVAEMNAKGGPNLRASVDLARVMVSYELPGKRIDEALDVYKFCTESRNGGFGQATCSAIITRCWAPAGQLEATKPVFKAIMESERFNPEWNRTYNALIANQIREMYQGQTAALLAAGERAQASRMRAHNAYMAVERRGADMNNNRFREGQYVKQRISDDRVDFLGGCERYPDGSTNGNCGNRQTAPRY